MFNLTNDKGSLTVTDKFIMNRCNRIVKIKTVDQYKPAMRYLELSVIEFRRCYGIDSHCAAYIERVYQPELDFNLEVLRAGEYKCP